MLRPSSSDGLRSHGDTLSGFVVDKRLDKRISRDDSWIVTGKAGARARQYIPPRGLPTPDPSPTSNGAAEPQYAPGPWVQTPREEGIGMAIGSPSLAPPWDTSISRNQPSSGSPATTSPSIGAVDGPLPGVPVPRKGSGKWKIFGMFGRRPSDTVSSGFSPVPSQASLLASRARAETSKESSTAEVRNKPPISRSQTMPSPREFGKDARRRPSMSRMKKPRPTDLVPPMPSPYGNNTTFTESAISQSALLDVNIPSIELERYSIMFEKVLNPQRTSLLARRQGALEQLKTVGESKSERKIPALPIRRATSPSTHLHARSPSFALFPQPQSSTPRKTLLLSPDSARLRSNTSPADLPSPTQNTFGSKTPEPKVAIVEPAPTSSYNHLRDSPQKGKLTIASLARARGDRAHPPRSSYFVGEPSPSPIIESPMEMEPTLVQSEMKPGGQIMKLSEYELANQPVAAREEASPRAMVKAHTPTASTGSSTTATTSSSSTGKHTASSSTSSAQTYRTLNSQITLYTDTDVDEVDPMVIGGGRNMTPAEVSIARQISLSRQQRKIFQQTQQRPSIAISKPRLHIEQAESARMVTPKSSTPTLIVPENPLESPYLTPLGVARSRKSERIIIDATS